QPGPPAPPSNDPNPPPPNPQPQPQPQPQPNPTPQLDIPSDIVQRSPQAQVTANLTLDTSLNPPTPPPLITITTTNKTTGSGQQGGRGSNPPGGRPGINTVPPPGLGPLPSGMPPLNETRFPNNEVVMQLGLELAEARLAQFMRDNGLEIIT